jgi:hypothetical protein
VRQRPPLASGAVDVEESIEDLTHVCRPRASALFGWGDQGLQDLPLGIRQVAWVVSSSHGILPHLLSLLS